jgi:hypothetical protein
MFFCQNKLFLTVKYFFLYVLSFFLQKKNIKSINLLTFWNNKLVKANKKYSDNYASIIM